MSSQDKPHGICAERKCNDPAETDRARCRKHLDARSRYQYERRRQPGEPSWEEFKASPAGMAIQSFARKGKLTDRALSAIPVCACGIRHLVCDMPGRLVAIATGNADRWGQ